MLFIELMNVESQVCNNPEGETKYEPEDKVRDEGEVSSESFEGSGSETEDSFIDPVSKPVKHTDTNIFKREVIKGKRANKNLSTPTFVADFRIPYDV